MGEDEEEAEGEEAVVEEEEEFGLALRRVITGGGCVDTTGDGVGLMAEDVAVGPVLVLVLLRVAIVLGRFMNGGFC